MKSDKYYTDRSRVKRELIWVVLIPLLFSGLLLINLLRWYYLVLVLLMILLYLVMGLRFGYPQISETQLIIRNGLYPFFIRRYDISKITNIKVYAGRGFPYIVIFQEGKIRRYVSILCMGVQSIRPFVEELRSKGVKVECKPFEHDGEMIYL